MEESVALDSSKQKQFVKSIRGIKKILKGKNKDKSGKEDIKRVKIGKVKKSRRKARGLVYLSHIPHGFYEHQMTEYFKQFGVVTNARVIRSKRTGTSKGHAFVEFKNPNVAQIVAETMNNYLMGKRLIKAALIPPEKQRKFAKRKHWNAQNNPGNDLRQKMKKAHNSVKDEKEELQIAQKLISNLNKTKKRLRELDIDYDFFTPVDIPETLLNLVEVKKEEDIKTTDVVKDENKLNNTVKQEDSRNNKKKNKGKKANDIKAKPEDTTPPKQVDNTAHKKLKKPKDIQQSGDISSSDKESIIDNRKDKKVSKAEKASVPKAEDKEKTEKVENNKMSKIQKQKSKKLIEAGVKPPEDFIQTHKELDEESDSSVSFDSDEYDKVIKSDSDVDSDDSNNETDEDLDEDVTSEDDSSVKNGPPPPQKEKAPTVTKIEEARKKQQGKKLNINKPSLQPMKKMQQKNNKPSKKPKFEKKVKQQAINKLIKKKK